MNEFLNYVSFRIEFFSLPTFKDKYVVYLANKFPNIYYKEQTIEDTMIEWSLIDVDTIAMDLDLPIMSIANHKNYVIDDILVGGLHSKVYVNPYYIFIHIPIKNGETINKKLKSDVKRVFNMTVLKNEIQIQNVSCIVNHYLNITPKDLYKWEVLDKDAFPQIYPNEINTGRYSDSHQNENGTQQILIREIFKGSDINDKTSLYVSITSSSTYDNSIIENFNENYQELYDLALNEAARCFK